VNIEAHEIRADDGRRLHVETAGSGPAVLFISGLGGTAQFWGAAWTRLAAHFRLISFDHRGVGRSEGTAEEQTMARMAADAFGVLDAFALDGAHVVGHSTGGAIAQMMALDQAFRIDKLVLSGTWARPDYRFRLLFETRLAVLEQAGGAAHAAIAHLLGFPEDWINDHEDEVRKALEAARDGPDRHAVTAARIRMLLTHDRLDDLGRIEAPTLVLGADDDAIVPIAHSRALARAIPGARLVTIPGGHLFPLTAAHAFAREISGFLGEGSA
jgi:aminoacrylate hydrolase